ncbi:MAG: YggS family pyridoxal phosphate-dependent enzyme [Cyclobacteriaceae bacterium]
MTPIKENLSHFQSQLAGTSCRLVAVSKTKPPALILEAYNAGLRSFGENRVQELADKSKLLPKDIEWHMIGHLQRNKVKYIAPFVTMIHAVDSIKLLREINKQALLHNRVIPCLLQVHIAKEESKFGFEATELPQIISQIAWEEYPGVQVKGLMGMATFTENEDQIRAELRNLKELFETIKRMDLPENIMMTELSMGMSSDYKIAIEEGSTMIRVGSAIFGSRNQI